MNSSGRIRFRNDGPPRWAHWLLTRLHPEETLEEVEGDLDELYVYWQRRAGRTQATLRYVLNVLSVLPPFVRRRKRKQDYYQSNCRTTSTLHPDMLRNYVRIALRRLWMQKSYTAINGLGLALGMTSCLVIYVFLRYELSFDGFHTASARTYRIVEHSRKADGVQHWPTTAYPLAEAIRRDIPGLDVTQTAGPLARVISSRDVRGNVRRFEENRLMFADQQYLRTFDFSQVFPEGIWLAGNAQTAFQQPNAVVLTQRLAHRYFADYTGRYDQLLGKTLTLNNKDLLVVSGIIRNPPRNTNLWFDMLVNYQFFKANNPYAATNWAGNYQGTTYVTLPAGTDPTAFLRQLTSLKKRYMDAETNRRISYRLQPLADVHLEPMYEDFLGGYLVDQQTLWALGSLAVFLILIASVNFINLTTAQAIRRRKEVGVRKVVGSSWGQLFGQFMGETLVLTSMAGLLSLGGLKYLLLWINSSFAFIQLDLKTDASVWVFGLGLMLLVALLAGAYPAVVLAKFQPVVTLRNTFTQRKGSFSLRPGLIVFQFGITYVLLFGTLVASRQMDLFQHKDLGFVKEAVLTINGPRNQQLSTLEAFRQQLLQQPTIQAVSFSSGAPITKNYYGTDFRLKSEAIGMNRQAEMKVVDLAYQSLFGLQTVAGRWFSPSNLVPNGSGFNGFVVNETLVKMLGLTSQTAIGKTLAISEGEAPIVGVVKDFHNVSLQQPIKPCVLMCWNTDFYDQIHVRLLPNNSTWLTMGRTLVSIENIWKQVFPQDVYQYTFLDESLTKGYIIEQVIVESFGLFAAISIVIACLGLLGLITFTANQRTKEISVRKVLGASVTHITALLAGDFLKLVLIAILIASPIAWYAMNRWLQEFAYKITIEWWMFILAGLLAVGIALLTVSFQSIKAALVNPVKSLRSE